MHLISIKLPIIKKNDPLLKILINQLKSNRKFLQDKDILVISEKVISISQGRVVELADIHEISEKARKLANKYDMNPKIVELILQEASEIIGGMEHVILTQVNDFLIANAGIDQSNAGLGKVILLPDYLDEVVWKYWETLRNEFDIEDLGIIIADSRVQPLRKGTIGIAIATAGFEPVEDCVGKPDLFGRPLEITLRAVADDLVSAAQFLLGEANEQTPVVLIRDAKISFTENPKTTPEMPPEKCLYMNIFSKYLIKKDKSFND
ncbi:MAG: coenzyme F420-0:L-glutamate ligase [Candidatus Lokiarchaeota archaeon]|nr:coenzyme F420-0:L-glutamate ligase [Candidatus Lokiarchaeota archaeon]MBD3200266.1 coenzyme F420-0:L-glutamate ligase [Candidatus Lokiarchaeota archaeon]